MPIRILPKDKQTNYNKWTDPEYIKHRKGDSPERRKERQAAYMKKHGKPQPRRKTLAVTDKYKKIREQRKFSEAGFKPLRAKKGIGGAITKIISKIKPKPKGVFKPKPVPKKVTDKPTGWSPKGSYTEADDKKITSILKKLGDEIKAAPLPPKLKATLKKAQKESPHKKAEGGRIGLKHGGSVGAAVRGHGAEIK